LATDQQLLLAYIIAQPLPAGWDGSDVRVLSHNTQGEPIAIVEFSRPRAHIFGAPNDEALEGHPLASRGLESYRIFDVKDSSWIRSLIRMNSVHPRHDPARFATLRHFIFTFHDSTFECVAQSLEVTLHVGSITTALDAMSKRLV
jgi:hypothetical protein